jgi:broad specificity phosphatase PhoE
MSIYVIRHGQTDWNALGFFQGHKDIPLNSIGIEQAKQTAEQFKNIPIDYILVSPLKRAIQTAEAISKVTNIEPIIEPRLIERSFGDMEGKPNRPDWNIQMMLDYEKNYKNENVEPIQDLFSRVNNFLDDIKKTYASKNVVLVTHGAVSIAIDCYFNGMPEIRDFEHLDSRVLKNCEIRKYDLK